jgi:hypothetical protein
MNEKRFEFKKDDGILTVEKEDDGILIKYKDINGISEEDNLTTNDLMRILGYQYPA